MNLEIISYSSITSHSASSNGETITENLTDAPFAEFSKSIYKKLEVPYPKFFKMDELSKLAFLAGEIVLKEIDTANWNGEKVAIILGNKNSSLSSDQKHYESFKDRDNYFPSPAIFVYTLPNIMMGELCIRHKIKGENSVFIQEKFDAQFLYDYVQHLFEAEAYEYCITGWADYLPNNYEAHLFLIRKSSGEDKHPSFSENFKQLIR
ncbi:MAG TPA: hypothetical protein PKL31_15010 [Fulvivirga sp.]|nr:hypothetical protein [Fulvivirga sp.]